MDYLWSPWRYCYITGPKTEQQCVFCAIAASTEDESNLVVYRGKLNFIVLNRFPYSTGHLMIVPYAHVAALGETGEETTSEMMLLMRRSEVLLEKVYHPGGLNMGMNLGASAGAGVVGHLHMHVLPRWTGDANFMTTVAETRVLPEELETTYKKLRIECAQW